MNRELFKEPALRCITAALSFMAVSCAGSGEFYSKIENDITVGNYKAAAEEISRNEKEYDDKNIVLYHMDKGITYHYGSEYDSSISALLTAERIIDDLYTKSISQQALSFLLNDNILPYDGEDFEKVLINIILALNYAQKGMPEDALVEARKVDLKLREYARKYGEKNRYREDAFIRYIAGVLYENEGEVNDAFISYKKSYEAYTKIYAGEYGISAPTFILDDLVRTANILAFTEEAEQYRTLGGEDYVRGDENMGSLIVLVYTGMGPIKQEIRPTVSIPDSSGILHTFQIALPEFTPRFKSNISYGITLANDVDSSYFATQIAEDITAIAGKALDDRLALIYLKSGGRAVLKFLASEKLKNEMKKSKKNETLNLLGSLAVDLVVGATEQADLRCWRLLPSEIQVVRSYQPAGWYRMTVYDNTNNMILQHDNVQIEAGKTSIVIVTDFSAGIIHRK